MNDKVMTETMLEEAQKIADSLSKELRYYANRKIEAARKAGTLKAAATACEDIVMMAEEYKQ